VLAGADKNVDVIIQAADGNVVDQHRWTNAGTTDRLIVRPGIAQSTNYVIVIQMLTIKILLLRATDVGL